MHIHLISKANTMEYQGDGIHLWVRYDGRIWIEENAIKLIWKWQVDRAKIRFFSLSSLKLWLDPDYNLSITIKENPQNVAKRELLK